MKKILFAALGLLLTAQLYAQATSNVILFTENGERFYAILNGTRMNDEPVTNLKVQDLNQPSYTLKVIFENKTLGEMNKSLYVETGVEAVYAVKLDKKGTYKLAFRSSVPIAQAAPAAPQQQVVYWGAAPAVAPTPAPATTVEVTETVVTTTVPTTTTTTVGTPTGENISMNINTDGFGMNVNINGTGTSTNVGTTTGTATTTTTTTTTTVGTTPPTVVTNPQPVIVQAPPCTHMTTTDLNSAVSSIKAKSFEDSKLTLAKQVTSANCLDAGQIKTIMGCFDYEATKLEFAKFAYDYCIDKNNYFKVNDAFDYESSIEELDAYIRTR